MTSTIKVDTISENTSANGVTIDGVVIKDNTIDVNGTAGALILDTDADTKIQASTDDNIEFLTAGKVQANITSNGLLQVLRDGGTTFGPALELKHQRGSIASPTIVNSGDTIGMVKSTVYDGTAYLDGSRILFQVDGTPGDDDMPSRITFQTVPDGSNALAERMRITSAGIVGMGANAGSCGLGSGLHIMTADSGATATAHGDELVIEDGTSGANVGMSILCNANGEARINFGDSDDNDIGGIYYEHVDDRMEFVVNNAVGLNIINGPKLATYNETAPDVDQGGLTLQQGGDDGMIMSFKSSDVAHGMTGIKETDTFGFFEKKAGAGGGLKIGGLVESGTIAGIELFTTVTDVDTAESGGAEGGIQTNTFLKSGSGNTGMGGDDNIFVCRSNTTHFIVKGDGEIFSNQSATVGTFDNYEDAQLVRAYDLAHMNGVINSKFDKFVQYNKDDLQKARLIGSDEKGNATPFVNITGMSRLHNGAIWQQYEKHQRLAEAVYEMAKETLGADKADAILKKHGIKLLN